MLDTGIPNEASACGESKIERLDAAELRIAPRQAHTKPWPSNLTAEELLEQGKTCVLRKSRKKVLQMIKNVLAFAGTGKTTLAAKRPDDVLDMQIGPYKFLHPLDSLSAAESERAKGAPGEIQPE